MIHKKIKARKVKVKLEPYIVERVEAFRTAMGLSFKGAVVVLLHDNLNSWEGYIARLQGSNNRAPDQQLPKEPLTVTDPKTGRRFMNYGQVPGAKVSK